jgi:hypothetical protein
MTTPPPTINDTPSADPVLEGNLRALTIYSGEPTALWQAALDQRTATRSTPRSRLKLALTLVSAAAIIVVAGVLLVPSFDSVRSSVGRIAFEGDGGDVSETVRVKKEISAAMPPGIVDQLRAVKSDRLKSGYFVPSVDGGVPPPVSLSRVAGESQRIPSDDSAPVASPRSVIRKATLELAVPDTRETFAKCQHLLRLDLGEFVEGSSLTGQGNDARGQLTLRVAAARMDEVLNTLRTLGKVDSENATGDDVSAQVVDLDAHLRNERQVEAEVLKLLESRKDAQLKDILELRDKLSSIRGSIESLQGRRDTLGRQISLASVLVLVRPDTSEKPVPKPSSLFDGFTNEMSNAWTSGLSALTQTLAFLIRIAIGGLIWWLLLFAAIAAARRAIRRWIPDPAAIPVSA